MLEVHGSSVDYTAPNNAWSPTDVAASLDEVKELVNVQVDVVLNQRMVDSFTGLCNAMRRATGNVTVKVSYELDVIPHDDDDDCEVLIDNTLAPTMFTALSVIPNLSVLSVSFVHGPIARLPPFLSLQRIVCLPLVVRPSDVADMATFNAPRLRAVELAPTIWDLPDDIEGYTAAFEAIVARSADMMLTLTVPDPIMRAMWALNHPRITVRPRDAPSGG
jgi:hypothetical protein